MLRALPGHAPPKNLTVRAPAVRYISMTVDTSAKAAYSSALTDPWTGSAADGPGRLMIQAA